MKKGTRSLFFVLRQLAIILATISFVSCQAPFSTTSSDISISKAARGAWAPNVAYATGDTVTYNGVTYTCLQAHTSLVGWEPSAVPALWKAGGSGTTPAPTPTPAGTPTPTPTATPTATPTPSTTPAPGVSRPAECPSDQWSYMVSATNVLHMPADYSWLLSAQCKQESAFGAGLAGSPSAGDGLLQVQPATRSAYASMFTSTYGHAYNNNSASDQIAIGAMILKDMINNYAGGSWRTGLAKYNGGPNYVPGTLDAYGRPIYADQYAATVMATYNGYGGTHQ